MVEVQNVHQKPILKNRKIKYLRLKVKIRKSQLSNIITDITGSKSVIIQKRKNILFSGVRLLRRLNKLQQKFRGRLRKSEPKRITIRNELELLNTQVLWQTLLLIRILLVM